MLFNIYIIYVVKYIYMLMSLKLILLSTKVLINTKEGARWTQSISNITPFESNLAN